MAKVSLSSLLDSLTGKLSGSVFQKSLGGLQLRSRVSPRNPRSGAQQFNRGNFSYVAGLWDTLDPAQISSWNDNAPSGVSGKAFFLQVNAMINSSGQDLILEYTASGALDYPDLVFNDLTPTLMLVETLGINYDLPAGQYLVIFATPQLRSGVTFISPSTYRLLYVVHPGVNPAVTFSIYAEYVAKFSAPAEGNVIGLRFYLIDTITGAASVVGFTHNYVDP